MATFRIWLATAHDPAHRNGGWAFVRESGGEILARAGGDRRTNPTRMALSVLTSALTGTGADDPIAVVSTLPTARILNAVRQPPEEPPEDEPDLRRALGSALAGRTWTLAAGEPTSPTPLAFATAWADLASNKAKIEGAFATAIPKTNIARIKGL